MAQTSRRGFLKTAVAGAAIAAIPGGAYSVPDGMGGALFDAPQGDEYTAIDFAKTKPSLLAWPSEKAVREHLKLYGGYVNKSNEILSKLAAMPKDAKTANQVFSDIRSLKADLSFALGGVKNHEVYFDTLGGPGGGPGGALAAAIARDFGSYEAWKTDIKATGLASRGWSWLAYDRDSKKLFNYLGDAQNTYPVWNCVPVVALDVYEHAYWTDYGANRGGYIDAWFGHLDWKAAEARFQAAMAASHR